jgi:hypothetical protein
MLQNIVCMQRFLFLFFQILCKMFLNLNKNIICKWKTNKSTSNECSQLLVMLRSTLQCLYNNLNPKFTYKGGSSNEHQSQEGKQTKWNQYWMVLDQIRYVGCTTQLQLINRQQICVHKQSKRATQTHFKPKLKTRVSTKWLNQRQDPKAQTNHRSLRSENNTSNQRNMETLKSLKFIGGVMSQMTCKRWLVSYH